MRIIAEFLSFPEVHCIIISHLVLRNNHALSFCVRSPSVWNCDVVELSVGKTKTNQKSVLVGAVQECTGNTEMGTKHFFVVATDPLSHIDVPSSGASASPVSLPPHATLLLRVRCSRFLSLLALRSRLVRLFLCLLLLLPQHLQDKTLIMGLILVLILTPNVNHFSVPNFDVLCCYRGKNGKQQMR